MKSEPNEFRSPVLGKRRILEDLFGILAAIVIAFGGLALVQGRLAAEEERLLDEGGEMRILIQAQRAESQVTGEAELQQTELTQEELIQAVEHLERGGERYLHEPRAGQLSMAQAVDCGKGWVEDFLLPRLGVAPDEDGEAREYKVGCFLWAREDGTGDSAEAPWLSYWAVELTCPGIDGILLLNASTGQVMSAAVTISYPIEYQGNDRIGALLEDYADSFGIVSSYSTIGEYKLDTRSYRQSRGNGEVSAVIQVSSIVVASVDDGSESGEHVDILAERTYEYVYIDLGLTKEDLAGAGS